MISLKTPVIQTRTIAEHKLISSRTTKRWAEKCYVSGKMPVPASPSTTHMCAPTDPWALAGFRDCISETIRYLTETLQLPFNHPLVTDLYQYLTFRSAEEELRRMAEDLAFNINMAARFDNGTQALTDGEITADDLLNNYEIRSCLIKIVFQGCDIVLSDEQSVQPSL